MRATFSLSRVMLAAIGLILGAEPRTAVADTVVEACKDDGQLGVAMSFAEALQIGGVIRFNCPAGTVLRVRGRYRLRKDVDIQGNDSVVLDGSGGTGPFIRSTNAVKFRRLTLRNFSPPPQSVDGEVPASVLSAVPSLELDHVRIEGSSSAIQMSGAATIHDSVFTNNKGVVLSLNGPTEVSRSQFDGFDTAIAMGAGSISDTEFRNGTRDVVQLTAPRGPARIMRSTFANNRGGAAIRLSQQAGNGAPSVVSVRNNVFRDNDGGPGGAAVTFVDIVAEARKANLPGATIDILSRLPQGQFVFAFNRFLNNRGAAAGAILADLANTKGLSSTGDLFVGNTSAADGGAITVAGGTLKLTHSLMKGNRAGARGAAIFVAPQATATVANTLVVANAGPSGTLQGAGVMLANVTVADNNAAGLAFDGDAAKVGNTILARNKPTDCGAATQATFRGANAASDGSCPGLQPVDAGLDALYVPTSEQALGSGDPAICREQPVAGRDLAFQVRSNPARCALGAFEFAPAQRLSRGLKLPEVHATPADVFTEADGYKPPPTEPKSSGPSTSTGPVTPPTTDMLDRLAGLGIDYSVPKAELRDWLDDPRYTPYPAIAESLVELLQPRPLRNPVYIDVIVWNYEHSPGSPSPRKAADVNRTLLKRAILEGYNGRHRPAGRTFEDILR